MGQSVLLARFEENDHLAQVEVDEVFGLMCYVTTEVLAHDSVPGGIVLLVRLLLNIGCSVISILYFSIAGVALSTKSCCIPSDIMAFLITAIWSHMVTAK